MSISSSEELAGRGGGIEEETNAEQRLSRDCSRWAGALPCESGKEDRELESRPRLRLNIVHRSVECGSSCMAEQRSDHDLSLASLTTCFHCCRASTAARCLTGLCFRL